MQIFEYMYYYMWNILWEIVQSFHPFLKGIWILKKKESIYLEQTGVCVPLRVEKPRRYAGMENSKYIWLCSSNSLGIMCQNKTVRESMRKKVPVIEGWLSSLTSFLISILHFTKERFTSSSLIILLWCIALWY